MNPKLIVKVQNPTDKLVEFTLFEGALLDATIISPKRLFQLHNGTSEEPELEERAESQLLKSVMGVCTMDISGKCTLKEAIELIRSLDHKQEVKFVL